MSQPGDAPHSVWSGSDSSRGWPTMIRQWIQVVTEAQAQQDGSAGESEEESDVDYAARMARARSMGFDPDDDWFHGTAKPITQFDASLLGSATGARNTVLGFFFTNDEWQASAYAGRRGQVIDVLLQMRKPLLLKRGGDYVDTGDVGHFLDEYVRDYEQLPRYPTEEDYAEFRRTLESRGYDSIIMQLNPTHRVAVVFHANQIRDRDAQFDPATVNSPNLLG